MTADRICTWRDGGKVVTDETLTTQRPVMAANPVDEGAVDALYEELFFIGKHRHDPVPIDPKAIIRKHLAAAQQQGQAVACRWPSCECPNGTAECPKRTKADTAPLLKEKTTDIEQVRVARREMEDSIQAAVVEAMMEFQAKTGMCPHSIYVDLVDVTPIGEREKRFAVGGVHVDVPL